MVENRARDYVQARIRAGVLKQGTVDTLIDCGVGAGLQRQGLRHDGIYLQWPGDRRRIDFLSLCGRSVWVYGQTQVVRDLIAARLAEGQQLHFEVSHTSLHDLETAWPSVRYVDSTGAAQVIECEVVVGADGFHGVSRPSIPVALQRVWQRDYPFAWLGILADVAPSTDELIYAWHPRGFAMHSMRSTSVSRLYLQVDPTEQLADWSDDRIWTELSLRMRIDGWALHDGPITDKGITPMRSFVSTPMRHGRLFLVGDAAHIVPPTGAKGLNLAVADVRLLDAALGEFFDRRDEWLMDAYSDNALRRVWRKTHFSWWMTTMLHSSGDAFDDQLRIAQLEYVTSSEAAATTLAENYTGLPIEGLARF